MGISKKTETILSYRVLRAADAVIDSLSLPLDPTQERKAICLLNAASNFLGLSTYQLSLAYRNLGNLYYDSGITGNALECYSRASALNANAPIRKRLKQLQKIPDYALIYSISMDISDEQYIIAILNQIKKEGRVYIDPDYYETGVDPSYISPNKFVAIYDPEWETEIEDRLSKIDPRAQSEFYRLRDQADKRGCPWSRMDEERTIQAMESSYEYQIKRQK